ncbi:MAG TPA: hypothetical protein PLE74_03295 [Candidatus Cloacimonadota bacterium]|nr:hypothetical protein [Candidatus Cloacimonadota bacterium]HPT71286.1 hypothetical protein [Candidatus Cloacimonadota bacterium]
MRFSILLLTIASLFIFVTGCDRFDHSFAPATYPEVEHFYGNFSDSLLLVSDTNAEPISSFYADNYMNNGMNKMQIEQYFRNLFINHPNGVLAIDSVYTYEASSNNFQWRLKLKNANGDTTYVDTLFTDRIQYVRGTYQFIGNQYDPGQPNPKQKVLAQMVTGTWCTNCPEIEAALHECELRFPGQFYYMEYHLNDILDLPINHISDFLSYYGNVYSAPTTLFQGITKYTLTNTGSLSQFTSLIQNLLTQDARFDLDNLSYTIGTDSLHATVHLTPKASVSQVNLKLNYALFEKVSTVNNAGGHPCRNVLLRRGEKDISSSTLPGTLSFSLPIPTALPSDAAVMVWIQTMNSPWDQQSLIYNVLEKEITRK